MVKKSLSEDGLQVLSFDECLHVKMDWAFLGMPTFAGEEGQPGIAHQ